MSVWLVMPSKRPAAEAESVLRMWRARGYKIALCVDDDADARAKESMADAILLPSPEGYRGYPKSINALASLVLKTHDCDWIVAGADDTYPDPAHTADEIAAQCAWHFSLEAYKEGDPHVPAQTFGVMQPTGDRWGEYYGRAFIDNFAGSPWIGRSFAERINQGRGPLWPEYFHNWADQELQEVAIKYKCFWQRPDLTHFHDHPLRKPGGKWAPHQLGFDADYAAMKPIFETRRAVGFPGSEPI